MRFRLFLILVGVVILSLASGLGLKFALAWVEPSTAPPGGNVPAPINVGASDQQKEGGLQIGGIFTVPGKWAIIGTPTAPSGGYTTGTLNAQRLCINGDCLTSWTIANAFVQGGNTGFGPTAILGTKTEATPVPLSIITNGVERMRIDTTGKVGIGIANPFERLHIADGSLFLGPDFHDGVYGRTIKIGWEGDPDVHHSIQTTISQGGAAQNGMRFYVHGGTANDNQVLNLALTGTGNVGIGTTTPNYKLVVAGASPRTYLWPNLGGNPELNFGNQAGDNHWAIYRDLVSDQLRFWRNDNRVVITSDGNVGVGTTAPGTNLDVLGNIRSSRTAATASDVTLSAQNGIGYIGSMVNNVPLGFITNNIERMRIGANGNVAIGTTNTTYNLMVAGSAPRIYLLPTLGTNSELDFGSPAMDTHWSIYRDMASDELRFWRGENNVTMTAAGDINSRRCFGPVYIGQTAATYDGSRGGYDDANDLCAAAFAGSHVCTTAEVLETIKCNRTSLPTTGMAWISNGPPGYTARANDCRGWTSNTGSGAEIAYGAIWAFDANGGVGWVTTCNMTLKFACCK